MMHSEGVPWHRFFALQAQAYERRLFTADQPAPSSQLHEGRTLLQVRLGHGALDMGGRRLCQGSSAGCTNQCHHACFASLFQLRRLTKNPQDLLCAATHARAAYGFPLAAGFMNDVASYVRLQTVQQLS